MNQVTAADVADLDRPSLSGLLGVHGVFRRLVLAKLGSLQGGRLHLVEPTGRRTYGDGGDLEAAVQVHEPRFWERLALGGSIGAAESYMAGEWTTDDLTSVIRLLLRNRAALSRLEGGLGRLWAPANRALHALRRNSPRGSRRNIRAHYDLGDELFRLFLDRGMMYSAAVFERPETTLDEAAQAKLDRICRKLRLGPGDHVLEIGTGWGGFAVHAASRYGCRVTTTTISPRQFAYAAHRVEAAGLGDRIEVLDRDYRELEGTFDKLVSIEMIEAVGLEQLDTFFSICSERLRPDGVMALQAITIDDRLYDSARRSVDFIQRYIFPGGAIPSPEALARSIARASDLTSVHLEDIGLHYAETLRRWRRRFRRRLETVRSLGFSERFIRMWDYYFQYCEAGFRERSISDVQLILAKPGHRSPAVLGELI